MILKNIDKCLLCGQIVHNISTTAPGYQRGRTYDIYECEKCLSSFAYPLALEDSVYDLIYSNIQFVPGYDRYFVFAHDVLMQKNPLSYLSRQEESYWAVANHLITRRNNGEKLKVLEIGCGMGYFTYALHQDGFNVTGLDLSSTAVEWAIDHYGPFFECKSLQQLNELGKKYDVIVLNQLIEHIPDVHQFISETLNLLSNKGEIILTTPNKLAYPDSQWETELPPIHLWWFGPDALKYIAQRHSCEISFIDFTMFYDSCVTLKSFGLSLSTRHAVFDEQGKLLFKQEIRPQGLLRDLLDHIGLRDLIRTTRKRISPLEKWKGPCGPVCACVLRPV